MTILRRKGMLRILVQTPLLLAFLIALLWLTKESTELGISKTLILAFLFGIGASITKWFVWMDYVKRYKVLVDDDAICTLNRGSASSVLRGQIRTIWEKKDGLYLSGRKGFPAHWGGYVWIPRELPEFDALKDLAATWKA